MTVHQRSFIYVLIAIGSLAAVWISWLRIGSEAAGREVSLCLDYGEVERLAVHAGTDLARQLSLLKAAGATHIALSETTLGELLLRGGLSGSDETVTAALNAKLPGFRPGDFVDEVAEDVSSPLQSAGGPSDPVGFAQIGLGYSPRAVAAIRASGLRIVARPVPDHCLTKPAIDYSLRAARDIGAEVIIFNGTRVFGLPALLKYTAEQIQALGLRYGLVEMVPQKGEQTLATALGADIVRVHSISAEEMMLLDPQRAIDRFSLAVTERKVRLCYVRLFFTAREDPAAFNAEHVQAIADVLRGAGYSLGKPGRLGDPNVPASMLMLVSLGLLGGGLWLLQVLLELPPRVFWIIAGLGLLAALGVVAAPGMAASLVALKTAIIFPLLAMALLPTAGHDADAACRGCTRRTAAWLLLRTSLLTVLGGLLCAAALTEPIYLMKIEQFRGVKLAQALPLLLIAAMFAMQATEGYVQALARGPRRRALWAGAVEIGRAVVRYWHVGVIFAALAALAVLLMRSGNEPAVGVSGLELKLRGLIDTILGVRPRSKEIFVGYPALFVGLMLLLHGRRRTAWPFLAVGAISQVGLLNTFCHMHTPLTISLVRVAHGLWVGLLVGLLWWGIKRLGDRALAALNAPSPGTGPTDGS